MASDQPLPWANWRDRTLGAVLRLCGCVLLAAGLAAPALGDPRSELQQRLDAVGRMAADFTQAQYGTRGELQSYWNSSDNRYPKTVGQCDYRPYQG